MNWKAKIKDMVCFNSKPNSKMVIYRIKRMWHDKDNTVELVRLEKSELSTALDNTFNHPTLRHVATDLIDATHHIITKYKDYDWVYDDVESDIIITNIEHLQPVGKTFLDLLEMGKMHEHD